jgi:hypothetical protein
LIESEEISQEPRRIGTFPASHFAPNLVFLLRERGLGPVSRTHGGDSQHKLELSKTWTCLAQQTLSIHKTPCPNGVDAKFLKRF